MAFLLLFVVLCISVAVNGSSPPPTHHNLTHPPPPSHPHPPPPTHQTHPPTPSHPHPHPPPHPLRKKVHVQGVVQCKSCKKVTPIQGAIVKLQCSNTKNGFEENVKTDKNGYFKFTPEKLTTLGSHKCKVFLLSSPLRTCSLATNYRYGLTGANLYSVPANKSPSYQLFSVGPFVFVPAKKLPCH